MNNEMKSRDVFRWGYKERLGDMAQIYWCCSRFGIWNEGGQILVDTFWSTKSGKCFGLESCENELELEYLGNLSDYIPARESDQAMYDDKDFLNLNHSNSSKGNCYIRKDAVKSKEKMVKIIKRNAEKKRQEYESAKRDYEWELNKLKDIDNIDYVYATEGVSLADESYEDKLFKGVVHE